MRRLLATRFTVLVGVCIAGIAALTATDATAKRIRLATSRPVVSVIPIPGSASAATAAATAATATVAGSKVEEAEQAAAIQRAQAKLAAESGTGAATKTTTSTLVSEQVNTSDTGNTLTCIAGCYK